MSRGARGAGGAAALMLVLLAGCSNPLASSPLDRAPDLAPGRLREVQTLEMERFAAPPAPAAAEAEAPARQSSRFEGMAEAPVSLAEARAAALENNLDLKVALVNPAIAAAQVSEEEARFESVFATRALWEERDTPTATELEGSQQQFQFVEPSVNIPLRTGGVASVALPISRNETSNAFATLNPSWQSDLVFSITHPLLRNAGREITTTPILIAGYNQQISEAQTKLQIIRELSAADRGYWLLYRVRKNLEVAQQQYELAVAQLERAERFVVSGRLPEIERVRAESGVAQRLNAIIQAQNDVLAAQRELKRIMNAPGLEIGGGQLILPQTEPRPVQYIMAAPALVQAAIEQRMEILETELRLLADAAQIRLARNQMLPLLDLDASYTINGLGGTTNESFRTLRDNNFEDWSIGARLEVPLGNEQARSRLRQALLGRLQRIATLDARRQLIEQEVLNAIDRIDAGWERILATRQATILSTRALQAEQRQFEVGAATSTAVLDAATRLAEAQFAEIDAVTDYELAQVDLAQATGTLLGAAQIRWAPPPPPAVAAEMANP